MLECFLDMESIALPVYWVCHHSESIPRINETTNLAVLFPPSGS